MMNEKRITGVKVVKSHHLPETFYDEKEQRMKTTHMITIGDTVYISPEVFEELQKEASKNE